MARSMELKRP